MATTPTGTPAPVAEQRVSGFGRIIGALFSPSETFADIARKPTWFLPVLLVSLLSLGFVYMMNNRIDWHDYIRTQMDKSPRAADIPADQKDRIINQQAVGSKYFTWGIGVIGTLCAVLIMGLIYWGAFNMFAGAGATFKQSLGVVSHASLVGLVSAPLGILVMSMKRFGEVTPENMLASNVGAFLSSDAPAWLRSVGGSLDIFWFWEMFLLAVGFVAINPKKISMGKALGIIGGIWLVWVMVKAGGAMIFS